MSGRSNPNPSAPAHTPTPARPRRTAPTPPKKPPAPRGPRPGPPIFNNPGAPFPRKPSTMNKVSNWFKNNGRSANSFISDPKKFAMGAAGIGGLMLIDRALGSSLDLESGTASGAIKNTYINSNYGDASYGIDKAAAGLAGVSAVVGAGMSVYAYSTTPRVGNLDGKVGGWAKGFGVAGAGLMVTGAATSITLGSAEKLANRMLDAGTPQAPTYRNQSDIIRSSTIGSTTSSRIARMSGVDGSLVTNLHKTGGRGMVRT